MHTYRKLDRNVWQVVFQEQAVGPTWDEGILAAAFAAFMNGGRYSPNEIEPIFPKEYPPVEADDEPEDHTTPPSKSRFTDYPQEKRR